LPYDVLFSTQKFLSLQETKVLKNHQKYKEGTDEN